MRGTELRLTSSVLVLLAGCSTAAGPNSMPAPGATEAEITAADLRHRIEFLADDALEGREAGKPGLREAADYLAGEAARLGLRPAGDGDSFLQRVPLERTTTRATVEATTPRGSRALTNREVLAVSGLGGLPASDRTSGSGSIVFGGHVVDPTVGTNELGIEQLENAVLVVRLGVPEGVDAATASPRMAIAAAFSPASPASAILLVAEDTEEEFWEYAAEVESKGVLAIAGAARETVAGDPPPFFLISESLASELIGEELAGARMPRTDLGTLSYTITTTRDAVDSWNVAAVVPGSGDARANEYVGLGAHFDHVGIGAPVDGDSIYNGADDNGSGTASLLEVAEALASMPRAQRPDRSVLFVWNTAEEAGLLGSEYFTDHPTVPRGNIVSHLNMDMVGRNGADSLFVVGSRRISTELGDMLEQVNAAQARPFTLDYSYDTPGHPEQVYCRSDHYNYARYGIPIIFLTTGLHDDYHAPSDEVELLDFDKMARVSELILDLTIQIGNAPSRPVVDQAVPPLGSPCEG